MSEISKKGKLYIVGIGPGNDEHITPAALSAIREAEYVIGYTTYIALVRHHLSGKQVTRTGMTEEIGRARKLMVVKYKQKSRYLKRNGHRQPFFKVKITSIQ